MVADRMIVGRFPHWIVIRPGISLLLGALVLWLAGAGPAWAQGVQPVPALTARVMDTTATLSPADRAALEARLATFEAEAGPQIVVLIVATTQPEDIAAYAQRVGESWKIGRREVGDGLLLVVAKDDRRLWIATAKALEGAVPDLAARQIIRDRITPAFGNGDYAVGLNQGLDALMARLRGEGLPTPGPAKDGSTSGGGGAALEDLLVFLFVAVPIAAGVLARVAGRKLGTLLTAGGAGAVVGWVTQSLWLAVGVTLVAALVVGVLGIGSALRGLGGRRGGRSGPVVFGDGGWSGGSSGSGGWGGGGGFSSGGGGDFGGGGAGGQW